MTLEDEIDFQSENDDMNSNFYDDDEQGELEEL